ncbi:MAG: SDR family NAD(P)-dependent oxidoreductase [Bacteroidales bacterium]|jgi:NADP-dependent 3-hydroxy acid dehydrogenase YdfG
MKTVLITGATSGIGRSAAMLLSESNFRLILCGRRRDRLSELSEKLSGSTEVYTLNFDIRKRKDVESAISSLPPDWKDIDVLINNAGNAHGLSTIDKGDPDDWDAMMDINVKGLLYLSRVVLPGMVKRKAGHIINIGSIAGKEVYSQGNVYCASKFAVDAITRGMRVDLNEDNIKVSAVNPGLVETEFSEVRFKGDTKKAKDVYKGMYPLRPEDIAEVILFVLTRPDHVNIADLLILPSSQASATKINRTV